MVAQHRWPLTIWIPIPEWAVGVIVLAIAVGIGAWTVHGVVDTLAQKRALVGILHRSWGHVFDFVFILVYEYRMERSFVSP
jgi:hypothetical protein